MKIAVYPGSFDPVTYGHIDIIKRSSQLFDKIYIAIMINPNKKSTFSDEEKKEMLEIVTADFDNVEVVIDEGLTVDLADKVGANYLVRGIRAIMDYEYELQIASANMAIGKDIETVFFLSKPEHSFLSSSITKSIAEHGGDVHKFIPDSIYELVVNKVKPTK